MEEIFSKLIDYLEFKIKNFKCNRRTKPMQFTCPACRNFAANFMSGTDYTIHCQHCNSEIGNIVDVVRILETDKKEWNKDKIIRYLADNFNVDIVTKTEQSKLLDFYVANGFDLVQIAVNQKIPIEKSWTINSHRDRIEWEEWLSIGTNIGVKTGRISNITVIDIDTKEISADLKEAFKEVNTLTQDTKKGSHHFFKYDPELPKTNLRASNLPIDIENDGGQVVLEPSVVEGQKRKLQIKEIQVMPVELKKFLLSKIKTKSQFADEKRVVDDSVPLDFISEGQRNSSFIQLGGILRKRLNIEDTEYALDILNKRLCTPQLGYREFKNIIYKLQDYVNFDNKEVADKILKYLQIVEDASARDIKEALGFQKELIDKTLSDLIKEQFIVKKRRMFHIVERMQWKDTFGSEGKEIDFIMPYFNDHACFRDGDMLIIGGSTKVGKSHIALNIIKRLVEQGKKPHYVNLESGNRFVTISKSLGLNEGSFWNATHFAPEQVEIEKGAVTIIDWLLPNNYAETDKLYKHFAEQLVKHGGILIIFVQLRLNGSFFAPDMISFFPSFVCKYGYTDDKGVEGEFKIEYMREARSHVKRASIPCKYDWKTKELKRIDELEDTNGKANSGAF